MKHSFSTAEKITAEIFEQKLFEPKLVRHIYCEDQIFTRSFLSNDGRSVEVLFSFPKYNRGNLPYAYASGVQIQGAIFEGIFCLLEFAAEMGTLPLGMSKEWIFNTTHDWAALRSDILYRKRVIAGEIASLNFEIKDISLQRFRKHLLSLTVNFSGFVSGESVWVINPPPGFLRTTHPGI